MLLDAGVDARSLGSTTPHSPAHQTCQLISGPSVAGQRTSRVPLRQDKTQVDVFSTTKEPESMEDRQEITERDTEMKKSKDETTRTKTEGGDKAAREDNVQTRWDNKEMCPVLTLKSAGFRLSSQSTSYMSR